MRFVRHGWKAVGIMAALASVVSSRAAHAQHQTGFTMIKRCTPNFAYDGATVGCQALVQNRDLDHTAVQLAIVNALTTPGPSTTGQPVCNKDLLTGLQKFDPTTLNFNGDDSMICGFDETIRIATCASGTGSNFVDDTVTLTGKDGDILPPAQNGHQGEPVGASASNRVFIACCGDGVLDPNSPETCDASSFPASAPATHGACRPQGDAAKCTFCGDGVVQDGEACDDGNAVDTDACRNNCTLRVCGDNILDADLSETCDGSSFPANAPATHGACRAANDAFKCTFCGDGVVEDGEACDDGNAVDTDGCRNNCTAPVCGDGILDSNEKCDGNVFPANAPATHGACRAVGTPGACSFCGDGVVEAGEACDDGNSVNTDACRNDCTAPACGDGILDANEKCDGALFPANAPSSHGACRAVGTPGACSFCGDGIVEAGEACDDGNNVNTDACRNDCTAPKCGDGILDAGEKCDGTAFPANAPATHGTCRPANGAAQCTFCGDGVVESGEACDDGNAVDTDSCRNDCTLAKLCGNGVIDAGETCDGSAFPAFAPATHGPCRPSGDAAECTFCGDGQVSDGETCDDGNAVDTDSCSNTCSGVCPRFVLLLRGTAALNNESQICGSFGVNDAGNTASISRNSLVTDVMAGDTVWLKNGARANHVQTNKLVLGKGATIGSQSGVTLPLETPFCPIPTITCGGADVNLAKGETRTLAPGTYGAVNLRNVASLRLTPGGVYNFCSLRIGRGASVELDATVTSTINVRDAFDVMNGGFFGPASGNNLPTVNVGGSGTVRFGAQAIVAGFVSAPNSSLRFGRGVEVHGSICALALPASDKGSLVICPGPAGRTRQNTCP